MQKHESEKRTAVRQHEERLGEKERARNSGQKAERPAAGKGKPDREEGVGTVQNQKR
jgi:hypothetical protein